MASTPSLRSEESGGLETGYSLLPPSETADVLNLTLHQCARDGDEVNMNILFRHLGVHLRKKINDYDDDSLTPLHYAARYNFLGVVKLLVENGADVNKVGEDDDTPLHHAARYRQDRRRTDARGQNRMASPVSLADLSPSVPGLNGIPFQEEGDREFFQGNSSVICYLISKGANINCRDTYGQTPLHFAAMRGNVCACKDLLRFGDVDIEAKDKQGICPLHMAAIHNQVEVARLLIEAGADLRSTDNEQSRPLHHACGSGSTEIVQLLFGAASRFPEMISNMVTDTDIKHSTCLHVAIDNGHYEVAQLCIEKEAEVNRPRKQNMYPLHLAAMSGDMRIVRLLVDHSARIDAVNDDRATALHNAAAFNHTEVINFLLEKGADINRRDKDNYTPLLLAATYGHADTVELLLTKGADYSAVDKHEKTAIFLAAEENKLQALRKLLEHPQTRQIVNFSDQHGNSPLHIASQQGHLDVVKYLLANNADIDAKNEEEQTPLHLAAKFGRTNIVREIIRRDKSVINNEDEKSNTALHLAAQYGHNKMAALLIELGAHVSARNYNQWTPLDLAAAKGWTKTCHVLLSNDAPIDPVDKNKTTPLHLAARHGHPRVVQLLLDRNANVTLEDSRGCNCLDLAIENMHVDVAMTIINSNVWIKALRNSTKLPGTDNIETPLRKLIKKMPAVAEKVFDRCLIYGQEKNPEHPEYEVTFNYEFLDDACAPWIDEEYRSHLHSGPSTSDAVLSPVVFQTVPDSLIKTTVMMIGEIDFKDIFHSDEDILYPGITYIIFVIFLVVMSILIMNLLVGLAVDDIKAVQEQASLKRLAMQVELTLDVEKVIPDFIWRKAFLQSKTIKPNTIKKYPFRRFFSSGLTAKNLQDALHPELDTTEKVLLEQEKLGADVKKLKRTVTDLQESSQRLESMLRAIIRENRIVWEDEDYQEEDEVEKIDSGLGS
ncbi:hypothetical protein C0Q70_11851 [Pomacea canaliculata]|uniref:Ion transport domain-containing protein n=1 Tax=Pomacea canaliculata TaxID=400727 RepID=A0A2T7P744_POMCA|nr:hypothetical protein C0Q70_11851 [Pomacea canaliculata]